MRRTALLVLLAALALPTAAHAAFPGENGKIAYEGAVHYFDPPDIYTMNPDGTGIAPLTSDPASDIAPAWSPDGTRIAFASNRDGNYEIYVMNGDGSAQTRITNYAGQDSYPAWSPDGTRLAFVRDGYIYLMNADGSSPTLLTGGYYPAWSPDGTRIAFGGRWIYVVNVDGTGLAQLTADDPGCGSSYTQRDDHPAWSPDGARIAFTHDEDFDGDDCYEIRTIKPDGTGRISVVGGGVGIEYKENPAWSPDGTRIAFDHGPLYNLHIDLVNSDGSGRTHLSSAPTLAWNPDWQPILHGYIRPKATVPTYVSLVPAYDPCASSNRTHGPPLAYPSCGPPAQTSGQLTIGTADSNGQPTKSMSYTRYFAMVGNPSTPADEADVRIIASINDVRNRSDLSDYTGELQLDQGLRITDKDNTPYPGGAGPGTVSDTGFPVTIPCAATLDNTVGSTCAIDTTAEAIVPNAVKEGRRAVWGLGQVKVYDGGVDGLGSTTADNTLFMDEGLFIP